MNATEKTPVWPKRSDGSNMTIGEMSPEDRKAQFKASVLRLKAEFESPEFAEALSKAEGRQP